MRKLTKALAAVLLLAVVVSVMAVLPTFSASAAASDASDAIVENMSERVVIWDMDEAFAGKESGVTIANGNTGGNTGDSLTKQADGTWKWTHDTDGPGLNAFWEITFPGRTDETKSSIFADVVEKEKITADDGTVTYQPKVDENGEVVVKQARNTDYIVVDFDISTDSTFINDVYFHARNYNNQGGRAQNKASYFTMSMNRPGTDQLYVGANTGSTSAYTSPVDSGDKWTNVTIVYDFSSGFDHLAIDAGGALGWKAYVYLDGYFVTTISASLYENYNTDHSKSLNYAHSLGYWRVSSGSDGTNTVGSTTNFANFTVSKFPVGYDGPLADGLLGLTNVHLGSLSDMAYTLENMPETPDGYTGLKIADIYRTVDGVETLVKEAYDEDDINGDVIGGDRVVLYRTLVSTIVARYADGADGVSFEDINGVAAGAEGSLVKAPTVLRAEPDADYAIITSSNVYNGYNEDIIAAKNASDKWIVRDSLYVNTPTGKDATVMLFTDVVTYGRGAASSSDIYGDGSNVATTSTSVRKPGNTTITYDLNGNTFTMRPIGGHYFQPTGSSKIVVKNGNFVFQPNSGNFVQNGAAGASTGVYFENLNIDYKNGVMIDQRHGTVAFVDCDIKAAAALTSTKSQGLEHVSIVVDGCSVESTSTKAEEIVYAGNVAGYGSSQLHVAFLDSGFIRTGNKGSNASDAALIKWGAQVDSKTAADSPNAQVKNQNAAYISIIGCEVGATFRHLIYQGYDATIEVTKSGHSKPTFTLDAYISDSDITSASVLYTWLKGGDVYEHTSNFGIQIKDSKINNAGTIVSRTESMVSANITVKLADGVKLDTTKVGDDAVNVIYDTPDSKIAYTSLDEDTNCIVTSSYKTYDYQIGDAEPVQFCWNVPAEGKDKVDPSKVAKPGEGVDGIYKYVWDDVDSDSFKAIIRKTYTLTPKANLSLTDYIDFNLYIPVSEYDVECLTFVVTDRAGNVIEKDAETITVNGVECYKFQAKNISTTAADENALSVAVTINGTYGDTLTNNFGIGILGYAEDILEKSTDDKSIALIEALLNYIAGACAYENDTVTAAAASALIEGATFGTIEGDAKAEALAGVEVAIKYGERLYVGIKGTAGEQLKVSYVANGTLMEYAVTLDDAGEYFIYVKACDLIGDFTITKGDATATVNIQGYYKALGELGDSEAQAMVEAIYLYAKAAADYKPAN